MRARLWSRRMSSCEAAVMLPVETVPALPAVLSASPRSISAPLVDHGGKCISFVDAPSLASNIWLTLFLWVPSMEFACLCCLHPSPAFPHRSCQLCYVHPVLLELRTLCRNFLGGGQVTGKQGLLFSSNTSSLVVT